MRRREIKSAFNAVVTEYAYVMLDTKRETDAAIRSFLEKLDGHATVDQVLEVIGRSAP